MENDTDKGQHTKMTFGEWWLELFQDERGHVSVKPVIALMGAIFLCGTMIIKAFIAKDFVIDNAVVDAVMVITSIGMGADSVDKFSHKFPSSSRKGDWESSSTTSSTFTSSNNNPTSGDAEVKRNVDDI